MQPAEQTVQVKRSDNEGFAGSREQTREAHGSLSLGYGVLG
jgi:hypothetical protein